MHDNWESDFKYDRIQLYHHQDKTLRASNIKLYFSINYHRSSHLLRIYYVKEQEKVGKHNNDKIKQNTWDVYISNLGNKECEKRN